MLREIPLQNIQVSTRKVTHCHVSPGLMADLHLPYLELCQELTLLSHAVESDLQVDYISLRVFQIG